MRIPFAILGYCRDKRDIQHAINAATDLAEHQVRRGYAPLWWRSRARYRREDHDTFPGVERINLPEEVEAMGADDCDGHAPYLAGSLRAIGHPARAIVVRAPGVGYHVIVGTRNAQGRTIIIDPSARRGMLDQPRPSVGAMNQRNLLRSRAALARAGQLVRQVESMDPSTHAARALGMEALRLIRVSQQADDAVTGTDIEVGIKHRHKRKKARRLATEAEENAALIERKARARARIAKARRAAMESEGDEGDEGDEDEGYEDEGYQ